jgi:uncharacterized delta-60 repeat protein
LSDRTRHARLTQGAAALSGALGLVFLAGSAAAAPGDLDPSFGSAGTVQTAIGSAAMANAIAIQSGGRILLAGTSYPGGLALARYMPDGALDSSFGTQGVVTGPEGAASAVAVQPDGRIVVAGRLTEPDSDFAVLRYKADGRIDTSFGVSGVATGPRGDARAVAIQPDGQILVAGSGPDPQRPDRATIFVARFASDGSPDPGFGSNGVARMLIGQSAGASALALQPDGRIVTAGYSLHDTTPPYLAMALTRYLPNGTLDQAFGTDGVVTAPIAAGFRGASSMALRPDGRIVVAGNTDNDFALARFEPDGSLDTTFGEFGATTTQVGPSADARAIAVGAEGTTVVAGSSDGVFVLTRYDREGELDTAFGNSGIVTNKVEFRGGANSVAIQADGRIVAGGWASDQSTTRFVLVRYLVTTPSSVDAQPLIVNYRKRITLRGVLTNGGPGVAVTLVRKDCYAFSGKSGPTIQAGSEGGWAMGFRPQSRTVFWVKVGSERTSPMIARVRPLVRVKRASGHRVRARVLFVRSLAGVHAVLQSYNPVSKHWLDEKEKGMSRVSGRPPNVVSGATLRLPASRKWFRILLRQTDPYGCYATSSSRALRG